MCVRGLWEQVGAVGEGLEGGGRSVPSVLKAGGLPLSPAPRVRDRPWRRSGPGWAYLSLWRLSDPLHQPRARWDDGGSRGQDEGLPGLWCGEEDGPGSETKGAVQERPGCRGLVRSAACSRWDWKVRGRRRLVETQEAAPRKVSWGTGGGQSEMWGGGEREDERLRAAGRWPSAGGWDG